MKCVTVILAPMAFILTCCGGGGSIGNGGNGSSKPPTTESGLDVRPSNLSCTAFDPEGTLAVVPAPEFSGLGFDRPVALMQHPADDLRWYVVEQSGKIRTFREGGNASTTLIDLSPRVVSGGEAGLLGMAFHPQFMVNGEIYLSYTVQGSPLLSRITRVISDDDGLTAGIGSETVLLSLPQPYSNHNGGGIAFGPDGYLYIGFGDGGSGGDPGNNGQDITSLLGAILRVDVDAADPLRNLPYSIPPGNPFASNPDCTGGCPEIFSWGFRNPWRWSFDLLTGRLWVGDVGQNSREEVDLVEAGNNYGWNIMEGDACYPPGSNCSSSGLILPVVDYGRGDGNSVTGGYVYRGSAVPALSDTYVYGDFGSGRIWGLTPNGQGGYDNRLLANSGLNIASFGQGRDGELYILSYGDGRIYSLTTSAGSPVADRASGTGYVSVADATKPADCFLPYEINVPFWSDGAEKERYFSVPDNKYVDTRNPDSWELPPGSVALKMFRLGGQPVEMRLLLRHFNGQWAGYTYEWNNTLSDFVRVVGGKETIVAGQSWIFPSESDCMRCHPSAAGRTLGLETAQLNRDHTYFSTGRTANQLTTFEHIQLLDPLLPDDAARLPAFPDPFDSLQPLLQRSKACFHSNCAQCHRSNGPTPSLMDLRYGTPLGGMSVCNEEVQGASLGIADPRLVAPGDPDRSVLLQRMRRRDIYSMPPLGTNRVDEQGALIIEQWIAGLNGCP